MQPKIRLREVNIGLLALLFAAAGCMHLIYPQPFLQIMPPGIPKPGLMVVISGIAEIAGGVGLIVSSARRAAGWCLAVLLVAVFPANIYMAVEHISPAGMKVPAVLLWFRLALQPLLIWWVLSASKRSRRHGLALG